MFFTHTPDVDQIHPHNPHFMMYLFYCCRYFGGCVPDLYDLDLYTIWIIMFARWDLHDTGLLAHLFAGCGI